VGGLGVIEDCLNAYVLANKNPRKSMTVAGVMILQIAWRRP
jgi:hypothetical protein